MTGVCLLETKERLREYETNLRSEKRTRPN